MKLAERYSNTDIIIRDWTGAVLFDGAYNDLQVDVILKKNECVECNKDGCDNCGDTGYYGDFTVEWDDSEVHENVYEHINY